MLYSNLMRTLAPLGLLLLAMSLFGGVVYAQYSSSSYKSNEVLFGAGGDTNQSSANYKASASAGALGVGRVSSANYQAYSGFLTPNEPFLELVINTPTVSMGVLDASTTRTGTASFHVRAYIDSGYTVQTLSQPPSYTSGAQSHTLAAMTVLGSPTAGTEQFGINMVHNTSPLSFGSDPSPQPDGTFATGVAAAGYDTANQYKYNVGDTIAQTPAGSSGWGETDYTISYIANVKVLTPAGNYTMNHDLVVVATY
jgi:hypothetical protein